MAVDAQRRRTYSILKEQNEETVGRDDRQEVRRDCLQRYGNGTEEKQQKREREESDKQVPRTIERCPRNDSWCHFATLPTSLSHRSSKRLRSADARRSSLRAVKRRRSRS